jgi:predicted ATPase
MTPIHVYQKRKDGTASPGVAISLSARCVKPPMKNSGSCVDNLSSPHRLASLAFRYQKGPDRLGLGEQNASLHRHIPIDSRVGSDDARRCAVVTVDKELFADTLPTYLTRFVGRDREIATVLSMLHPGRLVTVCGVGGAGKTRLAIEVAKRSRARSGALEDSEVYWVPLGAVVDPTEIPTAVGTGIGLTGPLGDRPLAPVVRALTDRRALLVLDNCEQVRGVCQELPASLLTACPMVTVLATSRVPLELSVEEVFSIPPLGGGTLPSDPFESDATALFLDRTTLVAGGYALTEHNAKTLGEICAVLHGLPLAIELAASWIPVLSPRDLLDHLRQARTGLASDTALVEERHRSLAVILDSSWHWMSASERRVLSALSERSLIQRLPDAQGGSRYQVHELVRNYALRRVEDDRPLRVRHFVYFLELVESLETSWNTPVEPLWSNPIGADLANIEAATVWALDEGDAVGALRIAVGLDAFWIFSLPSANVRTARLEAALNLPWSPSSVGRHSRQSKGISRSRATKASDRL